MSMNSFQPQPSSLPESDQELLSAYLDQQLSVAERVSLERRLEAEPLLRSELEDLRATAAALRGLEPMRPPRSFGLDPATARKPGFHFPVAWLMQLGSGLAGLALVLLATVQLASVGAMPASAPMAAQGAQTDAAVGMTQAQPPPEAARVAEPDPAAMALPPPARESGAAATAPMAAMPAPTAAPAATMAPAEAQPPPGPAGGAEGGPHSNSGGVGSAGGAPGGAGGPPSIGRTVDALEYADTSSPDTVDLPASQGEPAGATGFPPGLTLTLGAALIGLALVWHLYSRRRAG